MRVVLDTNEILAAGTRWLMPETQPNSLHQRLLAEVALRHTGLFTGQIVGEYVEKLLDLGHPHARVQAFLGWLLGAFEQVKIVSTDCDPAPFDPDDTVFILCAIDGTAELLVTEDRHLLTLAPHYATPQIRKAEDAGPTLGVHP